MKKRKLANVSIVLKVCTGCLMAMTALTGQHSPTQPGDTEAVQVFILSPAAEQGDAYQQDTIESPDSRQRSLQLSAPVNFFYGEIFYEPALSQNSLGNATSPQMMPGQIYIVTLDLPQPAPPPVGLYALSLLGLGAVGFLFGAPSAAAQLARRHRLGSKMHNESLRL